MGGWARHLWFEYHVGKATIASPDFWAILVEEWGVFDLTEYADGTVLTGRP